MAETVDLAVIGCGPAGMAAAVRGRDARLGVVAFDEGPEPGGQIYRGVERMISDRPALAASLGTDYTHGQDLVAAFRACGARYHPRHTVIYVDPENHVFASGPEGMVVVKARTVILATGAYERPVPIGGWTLPGVMTCGALQTALKSSGMVPSGRVVLAGSGPLLLLTAKQLLEARVNVVAVIETTPRRQLLTSLSHLPSALRSYSYLCKGMELMWTLGRSGVPHIKGIEWIRATGSKVFEAVQYRVGGTEHTIEADLFAVHEGIIPNSNLAMSMGLDTHWNTAQQCFNLKTDARYATSSPGVFSAGDCRRIEGARAAEYTGRLAGLAVAENLGKVERQDALNEGARIQRSLTRHTAIRPFLDGMYQPRPEILALDRDAGMICRCEEVDGSTVHELVVDQNCPGPNQLKSFTRCGMGPCQGRMCGVTVTNTMSEIRRRSPEEIGYFRLRPPIKPVRIGDLAAMEEIRIEPDPLPDGHRQSKSA